MNIDPANSIALYGRSMLAFVVCKCMVHVCSLVVYIPHIAVSFSKTNISRVAQSFPSLASPQASYISTTVVVLVVWYCRNKNVARQGMLVITKV